MPTATCWKRWPSSAPRAACGRASCATASGPAIPGTIEALAAILGGAQSIHTNGYDEALSLPTEGAARLALRTQQILAFESGVTDTVDPLGGAYAIETLTAEIEARAQALLERIDAMGGMIAAIAAGYPQREIEQRAFEHQRAFEAGQRVVVGQNRFAESGAEETVPLFHIDAEIERRQRERLARFKAARDGAVAAAALTRVEEVARGTENLLPVIVEAVVARATLGEIADALRRVFGEYS
jgi:methylmalonyl-CoA mutase N-terminal domain/subunit